jgi:hypothetical protein
MAMAFFRDVSRGIFMVGAVALAACNPADTPADSAALSAPQPTDGKIYIWLTDADEQTGNFLAVVDGDPSSSGYGEIEATVVTEGVRGFAHHTSLILPKSGSLFANDYRGNHTWVFDTTAQPVPKVIAEFGNIGEYSFAHSFDELPNGNIIASFQTKGEGNEIPGGIIEMSPSGEVVQVGDADIGDPDIFIRPYGLTVLPAIDRIVTTNFDMKGKASGYSMQVWRLSDLALLHTVMLPGDEEGTPRANPFEARVLPDGQSVMIETMSCGLYYMTDIASDAPQIKHAHTIKDGELCFLPVQSGDFWIQTAGGRLIGAGAGEAGDIDNDDHFGGVLRVFDISNPESPQLVNELPVGKSLPHWTSANSDKTRILLGGYGNLISRMLMLNFDPATGALSIDENFGDGDENGPGLILTRERWPHGDTGAAIAHGSVFGT